MSTEGARYHSYIDHDISKRRHHIPNWPDEVLVSMFISESLYHFRKCGNEEERIE